MSGGPVQLMAFGYGSEVGAENKIMAELDALQGRGVLRLLDFLFVQKTTDGDLVMLDIGDDDDYGTILAGFFPWDDEADTPAPDEPAVDPDELAELAETLAPGSAMALVLVEHLWAGGLFEAVEASGGELLSEGFITEEGEVIVGAEVQAISEAAAAIEEAHAVEAAARAEALQAIDAAGVAIEVAEQIRAAAAADALEALIAAGIIEAAAANEAADAIAEAGVIGEAAREAEDAAFEEAADAIAVGAAIEDAAEAEAEAAVVQEAAAIDEANDVTVEAGLREEAAIEEAEATEELAARLEDAATLSKAEKRVLHYLSTELTFAMIADKMGVSRGAVKDRAGRVYKKLSAHSREEAVGAAIELGVIKG